MRPHARVASLLVALLVPWTVLVYPGDISFVFAWGLANVDPVHVTTLTEYLFVRTSGLPRYLLAWAVSVFLFTLALASAVVGALWNSEDVRVTAGLLAFAGVSHATFALGLGQSGVLAIPVGTVLLWVLAVVMFFGYNSR
jgi:uncharacterized protein (TIGR04206 family)